jgi:calcium-dependent protein kinase
MGLCSSSETRLPTEGRQRKGSGSAAVVDEDEVVAAKADAANEGIRKQDRVRRASQMESEKSKRLLHMQGDLDHSSRTTSMASRTMQKMIHTQSSADVSVDDFYEMENGKVLGTGVTGAVRVVINKKTGKHFAHKLLRVSRVRSARKRKQMRLEVDILKTLDHPNIVKIQEVFEYPNGDLSLFMELLNGDELFERLLQEKPHYRFVEDDVRRIASKMFGSLNYLHVNRLVHRDIKLENFMFTSNDADGDLKLLDFGFSRTYLQGENIKYVAGTPYTMSPEVFTRKAGPPADVWAVAVCMYVLLYGRRPFSGKDRHEIEAKVMNGSFAWLPDIEGFTVSNVVKDLITRCLVQNPKQRLTAVQALKHPFFTEAELRGPGPATPHRMEMLTSPKPSRDEVAHVIDHLWTFSSLGKLRKTVLLAVSQSMSAKEIAGLARVFEELDITKDGTIGFVELTHVIQKQAQQNGSEVNIPEEDVKKLFEELDQDHSGLIKYSEFIAACLEQNVAYSDGVIADAFSRMDLDKSGFITRENLTDLMRSASGDLSNDQLEETVDRMLSEGDLVGDGQISLEELKEVMRSPAKRYARFESASSVGSFQNMHSNSVTDTNEIVLTAD